MALILTRSQLAEALGVSESTIGSWETKGCPTRRKGRGRGMKSLYDFDAVSAWCESTGHGAGLGALLKRNEQRAAAPAPVQTSALTADQAEMIREAIGLEAALLQLPAIGARAGLSEAQIDALLAGVLVSIGEELGAEDFAAWQRMLAEERARPGSWTA